MKSSVKKNSEVRGVQFQNFVNLTETEKVEVLTWRNHEQVRSMMLTKDNIPLKTHLLFIQKLASADDKVYWVANYKNQRIGAVYLFDIHNNEAFWGYYLNPEYIGSGMGILLEYLILEIAFSEFKLKKLSCESLTANKGVVRTHKAFGYSTVSESEFTTIQTINFATFEKQKELYEQLTKKFWE